MRRIRITRVLGLLLLGAATTVAFAWLAAVIEPVPLSPRPTRKGFRMAMRPVNASFVRYEGIGSTLFVARLADVPAVQRVSKELPVEVFQGDASPDWAWPILFPPDYLSQPDRLLNGDLGRTIVARGWPFRSCYAAFERVYTRGGGSAYLGDATIHGITLSYSRGSLWQAQPWGLPFTLPTRPIWGGFIGDTVFFAAVWWGLIAGFGAARRGVRRRRGQCVRCAYDLRGSPAGAPCPECGSPHA